MPKGDGTGPMGQGPGTGRGTGRAQSKGRMGGPAAAGPGGNCVCPKCSHKEPHTVGQPCNQKTCPQCGTQMTRV